MTDISDLLKSTMQNEHCSSLYAFLCLKGDADDEKFSIQTTTESDAKDESKQYSTNG